MTIVRAYALPHPRLAIPAVGRGEERKIAKTLAAFDKVAQEIAAIRPDTIIFITPHGVTYDDYFHISPGEGATGTCKEFGTKHVRMELTYDQNFAVAAAHISGKYGIPVKTMGERNAPLDYGVMVPLWFINRRYSQFRSMRVSPSKLDAHAHYRLGKCIAEAAANVGRRTVVVASGNLSRKTCKMALEFDKEIADIFATGEFDRLFAIPQELKESVDTCGYSVFTTLAGCLDSRAVEPELLSYESPLGEGYAVASFAPGPYDASRSFLAPARVARTPAPVARLSKDAYCILAKRALEHKVLYGLTLPVPAGLPGEMTSTRAGAFVSLYVNGQLRGAAGTLDPSTEHFAAEIIKNAVVAGLHDKRFAQVALTELAGMVYKVDIIHKPEHVNSPEELDPGRYGIIVTKGDKWAAVLPNRPGIETGQQQVTAALEKAGVEPGTDVKLERFLVESHM